MYFKIIITIESTDYVKNNIERENNQEKERKEEIIAQVTKPLYHYRSYETIHYLYCLSYRYASSYSSLSFFFNLNIKTFFTV